MRTGMNDTVHVQVEIFHLDIFGEALFEAVVDNVGVLVGEPSKHFGDSKESS